MENLTNHKVITPHNIEEYSLEESLQFLPPDSTSVGFNPMERLKLLQFFYTTLGFTLTPDIALALTAKIKHQLILAPAGGGKTTQIQILIARQKVEHFRATGNKLYGMNFLCLVYNKQNVLPMKYKQRQIVRTIMSRPVKGIDIDEGVFAATLHSFANTWIGEYADLLGIKGFTLNNDQSSEDSLRVAYGAIKRKFELTNHDTEPNLLFRVYNFIKETEIDMEDPVLQDKFPELELDLDILKRVFLLYEESKKKYHRMDYIDQLLLLKQLLTENESARVRVRTMYPYVVADEVQDFTPLMWSILKLIVGNNNLSAIGDDDQTVYGFKGANIKNILNFEGYFPGSSVFYLYYNRRCGTNILDAARAVIEKNTQRFGKKLKASREGGSVNLIPYTTEEGMLINVVNKLERMDNDERFGTIIAYRDKRHALLLSEMLVERGIPFNAVSGQRPRSHELYRACEEILTLAYDITDKTSQLALYKVAPISKAKVREALEWSPVTRRFKNAHEQKHLKDIDFGEMQSRPAFVKMIELLTEINLKIAKAPMKDYFGELFDAILKYFWIYKKSKNIGTEDVDDLFTQRARDYFTVDMTYERFSRVTREERQQLKIWNDSSEGVTLSTFHGMKGLEYDTTILLYFEDGVFPNVGRYSNVDQQTDSLEEETRLAYVALTRARDKEFIYYSQNSPSVFIHWIKEAINAPILANSKDNLLDLEAISTGTGYMFATGDSLSEVAKHEEINYEPDDDDLLIVSNYTGDDEDDLLLPTMVLDRFEEPVIATTEKISDEKNNEDEDLIPVPITTHVAETVTVVTPEDKIDNSRTSDNSRKMNFGGSDFLSQSLKNFRKG